MVIVSYCTTSDRMSRKLVSGKYDIQDVRYHMSRRTFLYTCSTWVFMGLDGSTCSECLPVVTCDFEPQSTCHGPQPGPALAPWCSGGFPACPRAESKRKEGPRPEEKKMTMSKEHIYT